MQGRTAQPELTRALQYVHCCFKPGDYTSAPFRRMSGCVGTRSQCLFTQSFSPQPKHSPASILASHHKLIPFLLKPAYNTRQISPSRFSFSPIYRKMHIKNAFLTAAANTPVSSAFPFRSSHPLTSLQLCVPAAVSQQ